MTRRFTAIGIWLAFLLLLAGIVLGGAELALRVRRDRVATSVAAYPSEDARFTPDPLLRYRNTPSMVQRAQYPSGEPLVYTNNSLGLRGRETTREKPPGIKRVIVVGGSTVYGALSDDADTVPANLERVLQARLGPSVEVINAGVPGYYALGETLFTRADLLSFSPDVVVVMDGLNDVFYGINQEWPAQMAEDQLRAMRDGRFPDVVAAIDRTMFPLGLVEHQGRMLLRSARARLPENLRRSLGSGDRRANQRVSDLHAAVLGILVDDARKVGARSVVSLQPLLATGRKQLTREEQAAVDTQGYWDPAGWAVEAQVMYPWMADSTRRSVEAAGGQYVDLLAAFDAEQRSTYAEDAAHYTPLGNRLLAEALAEPVLQALSR